MNNVLSSAMERVYRGGMHIEQLVISVSDERAVAWSEQERQEADPGWLRVRSLFYV